MSYEEEDGCICGGGMHACRMRRRMHACRMRRRIGAYEEEDRCIYGGGMRQPRGRGGKCLVILVFKSY